MAGSTTFDVSEAQDGSQPITVEGGITFDDIEVTEVLLGSGNDQFLVEATSTGTPGAADSVITLIHGGGNTAVTDPVTGETVMGGDRITVTGGGGAASPLVVYGDTSQDGSRYNAVSSSTQFNANGNAVVFDAFGNDIIDASASALSITAYGGPGNDILYGSAEGDQLAGGSGDDVIEGKGGQDHIYGDSGFNLDNTVVIDADDNTAAVSRLLTVVTSNASAEPLADPLTAGKDTLTGGEGDDIILGDHGVIEQTEGTFRLTSTDQVTRIATVEPANGAADTISGDSGFNRDSGGPGRRYHHRW
jgi:Ca2+-binding RTX toxin-like protein